MTLSWMFTPGHVWVPVSEGGVRTGWWRCEWCQARSKLTDPIRVWPVWRTN